MPFRDVLVRALGNLLTYITYMTLKHVLAERLYIDGKQDAKT